MTTQTKVGSNTAVSGRTLPFAMYVTFAESRLRKTWLARIPFRLTSRDLSFDARPMDYYGSVQDVLENECYAPIKSLLLDIAEPPIVIDAGANIGSFALYVLSVRPDAQVYSLEPDPGTFQLLSANAARFGENQWRTYQMALTPQDGAISFASDARCSAASKIVGQSSGEDLQNFSVEGVSLTTFIEQHLSGRVHLLKLDIEGAEEGVLQQSETALCNVDNVVMEAHLTFCNEENIQDILTRNYKTIDKINNPDDEFPIFLASSLK